MILSVVRIVGFKEIGSFVDVVAIILSTIFMNIWRVRFASVLIPSILTIISIS